LTSGSPSEISRQASRRFADASSPAITAVMSPSQVTASSARAAARTSRLPHRENAEGDKLQSIVLLVLRSDTVLERRGQLCNRATGCLLVASQLATDAPRHRAGLGEKRARIASIARHLMLRRRLRS
jgi:hypothetical protein